MTYRALVVVLVLVAWAAVPSYAIRHQHGDLPPKSAARARLEKTGKKLLRPEPQKDKVDKIVGDLRKQAVKSSQLIGPEETVTKSKANIAKTLDGLGRVLQKMHKTIVQDERVFVAFKRKLLENELSHLNTEASWPAIKDLVKSEIATGKVKISNELANFKVRMLDLVQTGLNNLRTDLRGEVNAEYKGKFKGKVNADVNRKGSQTPSPQQLLAAALRRVPLQPEHKDKILAFASDLLTEKRLGKMNKTNTKGVELESYGESALAAIRDLQQALKGTMSIKDLKSEIYTRLSTVTKLYIKHPTPAGAEALKELNHTIVSALQGLEKAENERREDDASYHSLKNKVEKADTRTLKKQLPRTGEKDSIDMHAKALHKAIKGSHKRSHAKRPLTKSSRHKSKPATAKHSVVNDALARAEQAQRAGAVIAKVTSVLAGEHDRARVEAKAALKPQTFRALIQWRKQNPSRKPSPAELKQLVGATGLTLKEVMVWLASHAPAPHNKPSPTQSRTPSTTHSKKRRHRRGRRRSRQAKGRKSKFLKRFNGSKKESSTAGRDIRARLAALYRKRRKHH